MQHLSRMERFHFRCSKDAQNNQQNYITKHRQKTKIILAIKNVLYQLSPKRDPQISLGDFVSGFKFKNIIVSMVLFCLTCVYLSHSDNPTINIVLLKLFFFPFDKYTVQSTLRQPAVRRKCVFGFSGKSFLSLWGLEMFFLLVWERGQQGSS